MGGGGGGGGKQQGGSKFLGQLTRSASIFPLSLSPQAVFQFVHPCTLHPVLKVFLHPNIVWRGEGRAIRGIQAIREVHIMLHLNI